MKKVLVTGAAGFIGSHLVELLVEEGLSVKAFVRYNSKNNWGWLENNPIKEKIEIVTGDIRDYDSVYKALKGCHSVFHLAALIGIPYSYISPKAYIETNIIGTYNILQAAKELNTEKIIITSSSETYGTAQYIPINECHPLVGQSPYSASKIAADQLAISYHRSFNLPIKIVRPFNTFGPRQSARAIIPSVIIQVLSGKSKLELGNLTPTRDLTYVKDTCHGFLEIYNSDDLFGEVTNIGMGEEMNIAELVKKITCLLSTSIDVFVSNERIRPINSEVERLVCDNSKLKNFTNWKPRYNIQSGLEETIRWIKNNISLYKSDLYNT